MERDEYIRHIEVIMFEEGWQCRKQRAIKRSIAQQRRAINAIAEALNIKKLSFDEVAQQGFG